MDTTYRLQQTGEQVQNLLNQIPSLATELMTKYTKPVDGIHYNHSFKTTMTYLENEPETIPVTDYLGQTTNVKTGTGVFAEGCSFQLTVSSSYLKFLAGFKIGE